MVNGILPNIRVFPREGVYEVLLSSGIGRDLNVSPVGLRLTRGEMYVLLYKGTKSYENLVRHPKCGLTVTHDARQFYLALRGRMNEQVKVTPDDIPYLEGEVVILGECVKSIEGNPTRFTVRPLRTFVNVSLIQAFSRADALLIDALVHLTRLNIEEGASREIAAQLIYHELATAKRLDPSLSDVVDEIVNDLLKAFKS
jgi:hypothetical protein